MHHGLICISLCPSMVTTHLIPGKPEQPKVYARKTPENSGKPKVYAQKTPLSENVRVVWVFQSFPEYSGLFGFSGVFRVLRSFLGCSGFPEFS